MKKSTVKKSAKMTEQKALAKAKKELTGFEGEIESQHTKTHWVFKLNRA